MTQDQARNMLPTCQRDDTPDFLAIIDPKKAHSYLLHWLQSGDIIQYYEDNPAARDALEAAIQESTRPMLQSTLAQVPCNSDILNDDAASVASQYSSQVYENSSSHAGQDAIHDQNLPAITQNESHPDDPHRDTPVQEQVDGDGGYQANLGSAEDSGEE